MAKRYSWLVMSPVLESDDASLVLTDPRARQSDHDDNHEFLAENALPTPPNFRSRAKKLWFSLSLLVFMSLFVIIYSYFVHQALLSPQPQIGSVLLSASNTNLLVSILSQIFSEIITLFAVGALDTVRWSLAAGPDGVSMPMFFGLSGSTQWFTVLFLALRDSFGIVWGALRLAMPFVGIFFGSILKFQATFAYYFQRTGSELAVFAGQVPLDQRVLKIVPASLISLYFSALTPNFLAVSKYAIDISAPDCSDNCTASFLPGGVEMVRRYSPYLNATLLENGLLGDAKTIQINRAPGLLLRFQQLDQDFEFDRELDCKLYGASLNDSIQICVKNLDESLAAGWVTCPTALFIQHNCYSNDSWMRGPMRNRLKMTAFKQFATTDYDKPDFSIVNVHMDSEPTVQTLRAEDFRAAWDKALVPSDASTAVDVTMIKALTFSLTWLLRLYDDLFPDDRTSPQRFLQNFLSIPQQFMIVCVQYVNYSGIFQNGEFALPVDLTTTAMSGTSTQRFLGQAWTVWLFISTSALAVLGIGALFLYSLLQTTPMPNSTGVAELDFVSRLRSDRLDETSVGIPELVRDHNVDECNAWTVSRVMRKRNVKLVTENTTSDTELSQLVVRRDDNAPSGIS